VEGLFLIILVKFLVLKNKKWINMLHS
jgi:hypothetical protein